MSTRTAPRNQLLTALLFAGLFGAWLLFAPIQLGGQTAFVIVNGNSMEPLYHRGDLVIIRAAPSYQVGDIVTYRHPQIGPVIHRIIGRNGQRWVFRGDHNNFIDPYQPDISELLGRSWLFIPFAGKLLTLVRQSPPLLALALGGGVLIMLSPQLHKGQAHRSRGGRPAASPPQGGGGEWALTLLGLLGMLSLALAAFAFSQPLSREVTDSLNYSQEGSFRYAADAPAGLYEAGLAQTGDPVFRQLSRSIRFDFDYKLASAEPADLRGSYGLIAELGAQNGWRHTIVLAAAQPFSGAEVSAHGTLELSLLNSLIARFQEQTGLEHQQYTLAVIPRIAVEGRLGGEPLVETFAPRLEFRLDELQLQLIRGENGRDTVRPAQDGSLTRTRAEPNTISPLGLRFEVALARRASLIAAGLSLGLAALAGLGLLRAMGTGEEAHIRRRYGALLVEVASQPKLGGVPAVQLGSIDDLVKLAERHGALILHHRSAAAARYLVQTGGAIYSYGGEELRSGEPPAAAEPEPDLAPPVEVAAGEPAWQRRFLQVLRETGLAAEACRSVGIDMVTAYRERERSAEFAQAWRGARLTAWQQQTLKGQAR